MNTKDQQFFKRLYIAILLILAVQVGGVLGFMLIEKYSLAEAFYMTVIIVSTVGLGAVRDLSIEGRVFIAFLIIVSLGIVTYAITFISTYVMEGNLHKYLKYKNVKNRIDKLNDHIIVCGYGRNGKQACEHLRIHRKSYVIVETNPLIAEQMKNSTELLFIEGDATKDEVLLEAGINRAKALITTLPNDADNVFVVLTARGLNSKMKIISRASEDTSFSKIKRAGADNVIMPDKIGGVHMATLIAQPDVLEFIDVITGRANYDFEEISFLDCKPEFYGKTLADLPEISESGVNIIGIKTKDGNYLINPSLNTTITEETKLFVLGFTDQVEGLIKKLAR